MRWFFEIINLVERPLAQLTKSNKEKTQMNRIRNREILQQTKKELRM